MFGGEECFNELDPSRNPVLSLDEDYSLKLQSDTLHNDSLYENNTDSTHNGGIEASDVSSLLAQFEDAADTAKEYQKEFEVIKMKSESEDTVTPDPNNLKLSDDVIKKIRALKEKKKSTIMLPMGMPSKRGRGSAMAMHSSSAPQRLQKIVASNLSENSAVKIDTFVPNKSGVFKVEKSTEVCANYYRNIPEHDYCQNVPKSSLDSNVTKIQLESNVPVSFPEEDILDLEDKDTWSDKENDDNNDSGISESFASNISAKRSSKGSDKRNYRKRDRDESPEIETGNYFDKIPSYYTTLSSKHNRKKARNCTSDKTVINHDIEAHLPQNPTQDRDSSAYSKLPAYYSCFTNSTKYDQSDSKGFDSSQDSRSSGYSSIPSTYQSRSPSPSHQRSPSRSRSRVRYNSGSRGRRKTRTGRRSSYSSCDSGSSSSRCSVCSSSSKSRSRSRCLSRDSYATDSSYSRSRSRSPTNYRGSSRDRSRERRRREREREREERKKLQIEERRIIYVGKLPNDFTRKKLYARFQRFGEIEEVSLHFREHGDNYGFVTYEYTCDAYAAIEKGNAIPGEERFDLCFGGRRQFCETEYADLDGKAEIEEEFHSYQSTSDPYDFDALLKQAQNKISKR